MWITNVYTHRERKCTHKIQGISKWTRTQIAHEEKRCVGEKEQTAANKWNICRTLNIPFSFMAVLRINAIFNKENNELYRQWPIKKAASKRMSTSTWMSVWKWYQDKPRTGWNGAGERTGKTLNGKRIIMGRAKSEREKMCPQNGALRWGWAAISSFNVQICLMRWY